MRKLTGRVAASGRDGLGEPHLRNIRSKGPARPPLARTCDSGQGVYGNGRILTLMKHDCDSRDHLLPPSDLNPCPPMQVQACNGLTSGCCLPFIEEEELASFGRAQPPGLRQSLGTLVAADRIAGPSPKNGVNITLVVA